MGGIKEYQSKYCYEGTNILINKFNLRDQDILDKLEADLTRINLAKLERNPIIGKFDLKHLQKIHSEIFKDIYPFAGKFRDENIAKENFMFAPAQFLKSSADDLFKELNNDKFLQGKSFDQFCDKAAYYMSEINVLHLFREGNGRAQREFTRTLALRNGYKLDWNRVNKEEVLNASISSKFDTKELISIIERSIENKSPLKEIARIFEMNREFDR